MHRGARRAPIFKKDAHCYLFLELLGNVVRAFELEVHAYSLMPNHYHLLVRSRHGNLSRAMKQLNASYTQRVNFMERWDGPVFRGRFRSQLVEDETHLAYLLAYIHLNPLKAGLVTRLQSHGWTSHRTYLGKDTAPEWLTTNYFETVFEDPEALHTYVLDLHRGKLTWPEKMAMDTGWLKQAGELTERKQRGKAKTRFLGPDEAMARICKVTGVPVERLRQVERGPRSNPARRFAVWALKDRTMLTQREIGDLLGMSESQVGHVLRRFRVKGEPLASWFARW